MSDNGGKDAGRDPRAGSTAFIGAAGILALIISFIALQAYFRQVERNEMYTKVISKKPGALIQLQSKQEEQLSGYRWIDPGKGIVGIPIERAMEVVASELKSGK